MNTLIVNQILNSNSCTELEQSTVLFNHLNSFLQREEKVTLDFQNIENFSMSFINSLHNQLYDYNTLDCIKSNIDTTNLNRLGYTMYEKSINDLENYLINETNWADYEC